MRWTILDLMEELAKYPSHYNVDIFTKDNGHGESAISSDFTIEVSIESIGFSMDEMEL